jgi:predicted GIY-YIG superfamily endonuclease
MANDWRLVYLEQFDSIQQARKRERQIKAWKSRKRMNLLIRIQCRLDNKTVTSFVILSVAKDLQSMLKVKKK